MNPPRSGFFGGGGGRRRFHRFVPRNDKGPRVNERIRVSQVRLVDEHGGQVGVVPTREALRLAKERGLDLLEVAPQARPPVCKICDYGKVKYEKKKKDQQAKKKQVSMKVKEIQLRPRIGKHDRDYKFRRCVEFLKNGDKVKVVVVFRGREMARKEVGYTLAQELVECVKEVGFVESAPKQEGSRMIMVVAPLSLKKGGSSKKKPASKKEKKPTASASSKAASTEGQKTGVLKTVKS